MSTTDPTTPDAEQSGVPESDAAPSWQPEAPAPAEPEPLVEPDPAPAAPPADAAEEVIEAEVVEDEPVAEPVPAAAPEPPQQTWTPAPPQPQVVYVQPITPPRKAGNRGIGTLLALASAVVFAAALAAATWLLGWVTTGATGFSFVAQGKFWIPVVVFAIAFVLLVLLANRANWWAYILGSLLVAAAVYFGTAGAAALIDMILRVPEPATVNAGLLSPFVIVAAVVAREISMWFGSLIARRGRKLKVRNAEARAAYEREAAERRAATGY